MVHMKQMRWRALLTLGVIGLIASFLMVVVGTHALTSPDDEEGDLEEVDPEDESMSDDEFVWYSFTCCLPGLLVPSLVFTFFAWKEKKEEEGLQDLAIYVQSHRRVRIGDLAMRRRWGVYETEKRLNECIEWGFLRGYVDRYSGEFFTDLALSQQRKSTLGFKCTSCGAVNPRLLLPGEVARCNYCGNLNARDDVAGPGTGKPHAGGGRGNKPPRGPSGGPPPAVHAEEF